MNTVELNSINLQSIDVASNNVSSIGKSIKRNKGIKLLPKEYQQVEYLEFTGTQYINTNILTKQALKVVSEFSTTTVNKWFFGARKSQYYDSLTFGYFQIYNNDYCAYHGFGGGTGRYIITLCPQDGNKHIVELSNNEYKIDNINQNLYKGTFTEFYNIYLGTINNDNTADYRMYVGNVYSFKIYDNDSLILNLIPCYRISDNEIGMYDVVNDVFYTNQGTGTFLKGADINEKYSPYIKGHITTSDSTFTFSVDGNNKTVPINANGDFKLKVKKPITSLSFVGVPQLESLELFAIDGVTTFDVDYPVTVTYLRCDSTTKSAKNDVYHIRGTATDNFQFTLKYIDDNNTVTTVTESAVIDGNGKWDIAYSGKYIYDTNQALMDITAVTELELTEPLLKCISLTQLCRKAFNLKKFIATNAVGNSQTVNFSMMFDMYTQEQTGGALEIVDMPNFNVKGNLAFMFRLANAKTININNISDDSSSVYVFYNSKATETIHAEKLVAATDNVFLLCNSLKNLYVSENSIQQTTINLRNSPLTYDSMLRVAGWLKDLTGDTAQTVTFRKATYDALTAEQKAELEGIIVTQKGWILATA